MTTPTKTVDCSAFLLAKLIRSSKDGPGGSIVFEVKHSSPLHYFVPENFKPCTSSRYNENRHGRKKKVCLHWSYIGIRAYRDNDRNMFQNPIFSSPPIPIVFHWLQRRSAELTRYATVLLSHTPLIRLWISMEVGGGFT